MLKIFKQFWSILDNNQKKGFLENILFSFIRTIVELFSIAMIIPLVSIFFFKKEIKFIKLDFFSDKLETLTKQEITIIFSLSFILLIILKNLISIYSEYKMNKYVLSLKSYFYSKLLNKFLHVNYLYFIKNTFTKVANVLTQDCGYISISYARGVLILLTELIILISILILFFIFNYHIIFYVIFPIIFFASICLKSVNRKVKKMSIERLDYNKILGKLHHEFFQAIKEIFLFRDSSKLESNLTNTHNSNDKIEARLLTSYAFPRAILEVLAVIAMLCLLVVLFYKTDFQNPDILIMLSFTLAATYRAIPSLNKIFLNYQIMKTGEASIKNILETLQLKKDRVYDVEEQIKITFNNKITFKNLSFGYENRNKIFKEFNFTIKKGKIIGIFGDSGSGKSTLLNLITLLFRPQNGEIIVDEKKIESLNDERAYQELFYYVSQDTFLYDDTIQKNIITSEEKNLDLEKIVEKVCLKNFIASLPDGIQTKIGFLSKSISNGQKQRIALARAFHSNRQILILDEATNALDENTEKVIFSNLFTFKEKKTIICVSHNVENFKNCDEVYNLKNGKLFLVK